MPQARDDLVSGTVTYVGNGVESWTRASYDDQFRMMLNMEDMIRNATLQRSYLSRRLANELDVRRSIDDECGYPATEKVTVEDYKDLFDRDAVAARVVDCLPKESWQRVPEIIEDEDPETETRFEESFLALGSALREGSFYKAQQEGNAVWEYLLRADILSRIGRYGCLLLGLDDGKPLNEPAEPSDSMKLIYLKPFDESLSPIVSWEEDPTNRRYGFPMIYNMTFNDLRNTVSSGSSQPGNTAKDVHWTRVIHIADGLTTSDVFGASSIQPVLNRVMDLRKLYGGSAEMFWRGAFFGLSIESHPQLGGDVTIDAAKMREQMENYMNGLQRYLALTGLTARSLAPAVADPTAHILAQLEAICIRIGIPKRIFMGSERGELASSQDDSTWNDRLRHRQSMYITPRIIVPFIDRLINLGVLPEPVEYHVKWPDLEALTDEEQARIAVARTEAMSKYVAGDCQSIMVPMDFHERIMGFDQSEAEAIVDAAAEALEEREEEEAMRKEEELEMAQRVGVPQAPDVGGPPVPGQNPQGPPSTQPTGNVIEAYKSLQKKVNSNSK